MLDTDALAVAFAGAAVALGVIVVAYLAWQGNREADVRDQSAGAPVPVLGITICADGGDAWWRLDSRTDDSITIDVFSHQAIGSGQRSGWRHELMNEPLALRAGSTAELPTEPGADSYQAAVAWYVGDAPDLRRNSRFIVVDDDS